MYYLTILTQFNYYYLRIQVSSYKKTNPKYPNMNGIKEFMTLFYGWIYLFKAVFKYQREWHWRIPLYLMFLMHV